MGSTLNNLHSFLTSCTRLGRGYIVRKPAVGPAQPLELYEFEACPFCRKVREVMSELDLAYVSRTCARGSNKRDVLAQRGGRVMVPYLVDPAAGIEMYESEDIITHLLKTYRTGRSPLGRALAPMNTLGAFVSSAIRMRGRQVRPGLERREQPDHLLELYNFEASPYCRKVREVLNELNLDYLVHNVAKRSPRRPRLVERGGRMMVPYLIDPNTEREMYESDDIVAYLDETYGAP